MDSERRLEGTGLATEISIISATIGCLKGMSMLIAYNDRTRNPAFRMHEF